MNSVVYKYNVSVCFRYIFVKFHPYIYFFFLIFILLERRKILEFSRNFTESVTCIAYTVVKLLIFDLIAVIAGLSAADIWLLEWLFPNCRKMEFSQADYMNDDSEGWDDNSPTIFKGFSSAITTQRHGLEKVFSCSLWKIDLLFHKKCA